MLNWLNSSQAKRPSLPSGSERFEVSLEAIRSWNVNHYFLHYDAPRYLLGGYEIDIFGETGGEYYFGDQLVKHPGLRVHLNITSHDDRSEWPEGAMGLCKIHEDYVEAKVVLEPDHTRDLLTELRFNDHRSFRIAGPSINDKRFWATMLMMSGLD